MQERPENTIKAEQPARHSSFGTKRPQVQILSPRFGHTDRFTTTTDQTHSDGAFNGARAAGLAYYNEIDPHAAAWLRELIAQGLIAPGYVDQRSITEVQPHELTGFTQCHFFAGIGGWSYALRLAGWPDDRPVWTGSCPCQPFSIAGKRQGTRDDRDLWPCMAGLIKHSAPAVVFGEQVDGAVRWGWLDRLADDLEATGYAIGAAILGACSIGAPHIRARLYWSAIADCDMPRFENDRGASEPWLQSEFERLVQEAVRLSKPARNRDGLDDGLPARVVRVRGYGNAIVPQVAATFIRSVMEAAADAKAVAL